MPRLNRGQVRRARELLRLTGTAPKGDTSFMDRKLSHPEQRTLKKKPYGLKVPETAIEGLQKARDKLEAARKLEQVKLGEEIVHDAENALREDLELLENVKDDVLLETFKRMLESKRFRRELHLRNAGLQQIITRYTHDAKHRETFMQRKDRRALKEAMAKALRNTVKY